MTGSIAPLPLPPVGDQSPASNYNRSLSGYTQRALSVLIQGVQWVGKPVQLPVATVAELNANPSIYRPNQGRTAYCVDLAGTTSGAPVYADGIRWRIYSDNGTVS